MEVVHGINGELDGAAISADGQAQFNPETFKRGIEVIAIHLEWFPGGEGGAGIEFAAIGPGRKIAEHRDAETAGPFCRRF